MSFDMFLYVHLFFWDVLLRVICYIFHFTVLESTAVQLSRYLLRTVCSDLFNVVLTFLADDSGITLPSEDLITMKVCMHMHVHYNQITYINTFAY